MFSNIKEQFKNFEPSENYGTVNKIVGNMIESIGPSCKLGDICIIECEDYKLMTEVVGYENNTVTLMAYNDIYGIKPGDKVYSTRESLMIKVGDDLKGRILDGVGLPLDEKPITVSEKRSIYSKPISPFHKKLINEQIEVGVKAIDSLIPVGQGQRVGLFAGSGVGKTSLLASIAKESNADINVIALIGERGRELQEFVENELGPGGMKKSVIVVATSEQPAIMKIKAAFTATTIAEYFRDQGLNVMLFMDSVTRLAQAQREISVATGEKVATKGYTPSTFALIPKLLERSGTSQRGSITGIYTVLVDSDDFNEPIADCVRGILDGHIVLDRKLAHSGHFPAIDILSSISRVSTNITSKEHYNDMAAFREILHLYKMNEDLLSVGSYQKGFDIKTDRAIELYPECISFLKQGRDDFYSKEQSIQQMSEIANK